MDYEKKYKDALEKAKEVYNRKDATDGGKLILESMFPELKENEDEKMREMAIKAVYAPEAQSCIKSWGVNPDDVIAWLEKQGKLQVKTGLEWYNTIDDACDERYLEEYAHGEYCHEQSFKWGFQEGVEWLEKQGAHKPIISNNALREGIAHFGITQYQIDNWLKKYVDVEGNYYDGVLRALRVDELYKLQEKQGKQILANSAKTCKDGYSPKFRVGDTIKCKYDDRQFTIKSVDFNKGTYTYTQENCGNDIDYADEEFELVEQKPVDKAQPKFKVGDWITNSIEKVQIIGYDIDYGYQVDYKGNLQHRDTDIIEKEYHLWSIQDAKDGDVLYTTCGGKNKMIFIYNGIDVDSVCCYCLYSITGIKYEMFNTVCHIKSDICPATKEQRDTLMKAIADAGYEWDFEVKEFNKIEKKSVCSEEEKQLLLKDLCARLPYKVRCKCVSGLGGGETERGVLKYVGNCYGVISNYYEGVPLHSGFVNNVFYPIENIKPYLRPMSSMTEEEFQKLRSICPHSIINKTNVTEWFVGINGSDYGRISRVDEISEFIDWLNAHYFDFRGLIEKGLALEAPEGMYNGFQKHDL